MALTDAQKADVRRFAGFPQVGANHATDASRDFAYGWTLPGTWETMTSVLDNLRPENEATLIDVYLTPLALRESEIQGAAANLDTSSASVWVHDPNEVANRRALFTYLRREMCAFLGFAPGPGLRSNNQIVRG
jgi:hypothetical protein